MSSPARVLTGLDSDATEHYLAQFEEPAGYLDFARVGPPSRPVAEAVSAAVAATVTAGPTTIDDLMATQDRVIASVSRLSGFPPDSIALVPNTSTGLFQAAFALSGQVVVGRHEFPSNVYPWVRAEEAGRLEVRAVEPGRARMTPGFVNSVIEERTTAVSVSAVDFATGYRADLAGLRQAIGDRLLIVDGIQGFGAVDLPWPLADVLVVGGQKWLRAGWGTGFLALSPRASQRLHPLLSGWTGAERPSGYDGRIHPRAPGAAQHSLTNLSPVVDAGFAAALELVEQVTPQWIERRIAERVDELLEALDRVGAQVRSPRARDDRAGIVSFALPDVDPQSLAGPLAGAGISATVHPGQVRVSVHATTGSDSVQTLAGVLEAASR